MNKREVLDLIRERMLRAEVPITHNFRLVLGLEGAWVLSNAGGSGNIRASLSGGSMLCYVKRIKQGRL